MISIPFYYHRLEPGLRAASAPRRLEMIEWVGNNNGKVVRTDGASIGTIKFVGIIKSIDFENEEDATAFKLRFGL